MKVNRSRGSRFGYVACDFYEGLSDFFSELESDEVLGLEFNLNCCEEFPYKEDFKPMEGDFYATMCIEISSYEDSSEMRVGVKVDISDIYLPEAYGIKAYDECLLAEVQKYLENHTELHTCIQDTIYMEAAKAEDALGDMLRIASMSPSSRSSVVFYVELRGELKDLLKRLLAYIRETTRKEYQEVSNQSEEVGNVERD